MELYPLLRTLDPYSETVPRAFSFNSFRARYSVREETQWGVKYKGAANTAELRRLLLLGCDTIPPIMLRRTKAEVLTDLYLGLGLGSGSGLGLASHHATPHQGGGESTYNTSTMDY